MVGFGVVRWACVFIVAIGGIPRCVRPSTQRGRTPRWPCPSMPCPSSRMRFGAGGGVDLVRDSVCGGIQEPIEVEATEQVSADPSTIATRSKGDQPQRRPPEAAGHARPKPNVLAARDTQAAEGLVLSGDPGTAPPDRPGAVHGRRRGLRRPGYPPASVDDLVAALGVGSGEDIQVRGLTGCTGLDGCIGSHSAPAR